MPRVCYRTPRSPTIEAPNFDLNDSYFVCSICYVYQDGKLFQLHEVLIAMPKARDA